MPIDPTKIIDFLKIIGGLKDLERFRGQFFWKDYEQRARYESVADHTWRMAILLMLVEKHLSQPIDISKSLKMVLVHDIAEVIAGDLSPLGSDGTGNDSHLHNKEAAKSKHENELAAAKEIFSKLPTEQGKELFDLWLECEKQESFETKVVKALDKIEGKLQAAEYLKGLMYEKHLDFCLKYGTEKYDVDPAIKELDLAVNAEISKNYREFKKITQSLNSSKTLPLEIFYTYFSPYTGHTIEIDGVTFPTVEHAYQCARYTDPKIIEEIRAAKSAVKSWEISSKYKQFQIGDFKNEEHKLTVMKKLMELKTAQHDDVRKALVDSGNLKIVKHIVSGPPGDGFWDDGEDGKGHNHMGRMWMEIRDTLISPASF